jgi:hypothetical protein
MEKVNGESAGERKEAAEYLHNQAGRISGTFTAPEVVGLLVAYRKHMVANGKA